jgi:hypothetical protein
MIVFSTVVHLSLIKKHYLPPITHPDHPSIQVVPKKMKIIVVTFPEQKKKKINITYKNRLTYFRPTSRKLRNYFLTVIQPMQKKINKPIIDTKKSSLYNIKEK